MLSTLRAYVTFTRKTRLRLAALLYRTGFAPVELLQLVLSDVPVIYSKAPDLAWRHDVVIIEAEPEKLMWVGLADIFETGGRHTIETGVFQATCVDATVVPFVK